MLKARIQISCCLPPDSRLTTPVRHQNIHRPQPSRGSNCARREVGPLKGSIRRGALTHRGTKNGEASEFHQVVLEPVSVREDALLLAFREGREHAVMVTRDHNPGFAGHALSKPRIEITKPVNLSSVARKPASHEKVPAVDKEVSLGQSPELPVAVVSVADAHNSCQLIVCLLRYLRPSDRRRLVRRSVEEEDRLLRFSRSSTRSKILENIEQRVSHY